MIEGYCRRCAEFIPLAIDLICPHCCLPITTLKIDDVGRYILQEWAELAAFVPTSLLDIGVDIQESPAPKRSSPTSPRLRLVP